MHDKKDDQGFQPSFWMTSLCQNWLQIINVYYVNYVRKERKLVVRESLRKVFKARIDSVFLHKKKINLRIYLFFFFFDFVQCKGLSEW